MNDMELKRLEELAVRAARSGRCQFTRFLEPSMAVAARTAANQAGVKAVFHGGFPDAERCIAAFYDDVPPEEWEYPIEVLRISWNAKYADPGHRDLLGAVMGLGIERDMTGDIALGEYRGEPCAYLFVMPEVADYVIANFESAGRASVKVHRADEEPAIKPPEGTHMRITVQNMRLDAVLAAGCKLSRSEAQKLINAGLVKLNHIVQIKSDARIEHGDLISARGYGRMKVEDMQGETRKGRQGVVIFRYGK
jgi:RNA-binding protein YlmH